MWRQFEPVARAIAAQRGHLFQWVPVCLAIGISTYFGLSMEPGVSVYAWIGAAAAVLTLLTCWSGEKFSPIVTALVLVLLGGLLAGARAYWVSEPVLSYRYYGPVQGRIVKVDRSASDAVRLTLDRVVLKKMSPARTPERVRVSLHGQQGYIDPEPGLTVILTGHLGPPSGPVEPGGFDFQRHAWFDRLGALGYTRTPVLTLYPAAEGTSGLFVHRLRMRISKAVQKAVPGEAGAFAAAVMTGDRSGMGLDTIENLRASNLSHLLAISGLHMGLLTGFIFSSLRYGMALVPRIALRWPLKKLSALVALGVGAAYLALSGGNVATERAFIMVAVMFVAVLLDRRALTLRAVAVAAVIVLVFRPEALGEPGFQMSFAATTALVAVFGAMRNWDHSRVPKFLRPVLAVAMSSAVAGLATGPVAAAHFNRIADYGLLANLMSVPLMGLVVMPGAVLAACLSPFGLGWVGLEIMAPAIRWILGVAQWVSGLDGAVSHVTAPPPVVLPVLAIGALWIVLWQGRWFVRGVGVIPVVFAFALWASAERPALLISDTGGLVGLWTPEGRVLNKPKGDGFAALSWLENDGDGVVQAAAFERAGIDGPKGSLAFQVGETDFYHLSGRGAADRVADNCGALDVVVMTAKLDEPAGDCLVLDRNRLADLGSVAVYLQGEGVKIVGAREVSGERLWNSRDVRRKRLGNWRSVFAGVPPK